MPAVSKKQQRFFGIVRAAQKGTLPTGKTTPEVQRAASSMKKKDVKKMASTKHKGLPEKKKTVDEDVDFTYPNVRRNRRFSTGMKLSMNPTTGMGAKKSTKNNPDGDDIRNSTYNSIKRKERKKEVMSRKIASKIMSIKKESFNEDAKMAKQSDEKLQAAHKKFSSMDKSPANTFMLKRIQREMNKRKKNVKYSMKEDYVKELEDGLVKMDYPTYDEVDELMKKIAKDNNIDTTVLHMAFKTKHLMVPDDWAKKKMFEPMMLDKKPEVKEGTGDDKLKQVAKDRGLDLTNARERMKAMSISRQIAMKGNVNNPDGPTPKVEKLNDSFNINEDDGNYHMNKIARERGLDLTDPRQRRRANSLARHNAAKGNVNNPAGFSKRKKRKKIQTEGNLHQWFKGSKSKDGKGGWVNVVTGGTCASDEPGEGTPKCVSSSKRASMTKAERLSASRRKKKADPNQQSKSGAAKPTYVSTDKPKKKVSEGITYINPNKNRTEVGTPKGMKPENKKKPQEKPLTKVDYENLAAEYAPQGEGLDERLGGKGVSRKAAAGSIYPGKKGDGDYPDSDRGAGNKAKRRSGQKVETKSPSFMAYLKNKKKVSEAMAPRRTESDIRRSTEKSMYDTSDGESEISKRTRVARKLALSGNLKDRQKGKEMEAETSRKLIAAEVMWEAKKKIERDEYGDIVGGPPISKKQRAKNLAKNEKDEKIVRSEAYSSRPSNVKKKAKLNAALKRLEDMKVASKMKKEEVEQINEFKKSPAWQRKAGKSESGGLNAKGVASYRAANPGSKLKTAVTTKPSKLKKGSKSAKRRLSFCRRMKGMKKKLTSAKTARDPDSRINKSLRKWNCSFEPEHGEVISEGKVAKMVKSLRRKTKVLEKGQKKERDAGAIAAKIMRQKEHNKYVSFLPVDEEKKIPKNVKKIAKELDAAVKMHSSQADRLRKAGISEDKKKCGEGEYYCNDMKKCRPIPKGYRVGYGGMLKPENENDESNGKKGGSNGNGNGNGGNGNGHGGNGNGGNGGGNGSGE